MINNIKEYLEKAFESVPSTKKTIDLKNELFTNMSEKYKDKVDNGMSEQEAYEYVIAGIGDIDELLESVKEPVLTATPVEIKKRAFSTAAAVGLFIISPMFVVMSGGNNFGILLMFTAVSIAAGILVYNSMLRQRYTKAGNTLVEEFKEFRVNNEKKRAAFKAFKSAYWSIVTAIYLLVSFTLMIWHISWIIFIIAAAFENIVKGFMELWDDKREG